MSDLKPCPFCGAVPEAWAAMLESSRYVTCHQCWAEGPYGEENRAAAVERWNYRAADPAGATPGCPSGGLSGPAANTAAASPQGPPAPTRSAKDWARHYLERAKARDEWLLRECFDQAIREAEKAAKDAAFPKATSAAYEIGWRGAREACARYADDFARAWSKNKEGVPQTIAQDIAAKCRALQPPEEKR